MDAECIRDPSLENELGTVDYSDCSSGISDSESDLSSSAGNFVALDAPGSLKRACGVGACEYDSSLKRRHKAAKLDERLDGLRAVLPEGDTLSKERPAIVLDAYHYITTLQRQVEDLMAELLDDSSSNSAHTRPEELFCEGQWSVSYHSGEPVVSVAKQNGLLEVSIVCANRPGLLVEIMEAIESAGLTIMYTRIACHNETVVEHLSLEMNEDTQEAEGEEERVKTMLLRAISQGPVDSHLQ